MKKRTNFTDKDFFKKDGIGLLHRKTQKWISEIEFVRVEQEFLKELLSEHIIEFCNSHNIETVKELLVKIEEENELGTNLLKSICRKFLGYGRSDYAGDHRFCNRYFKRCRKW